MIRGTAYSRATRGVNQGALARATRGLLLPGIIVVAPVFCPPLLAIALLSNPAIATVTISNPASVVQPLESPIAFAVAFDEPLASLRSLEKTQKTTQLILPTLSIRAFEGVRIAILLASEPMMVDAVMDEPAIALLVPDEPSFGILRLENPTQEWGCCND